MRIEKLGRKAEPYRRLCFPFESARQAFTACLQALDLAPGEQVLLPAFIGWSPKEGSGVFDPIGALGLDYEFYRVDERLRIDLEHLESRLRTGQVRVFVIIHYFGYIDPSYHNAINLARRYGAFVVEDEAHAMLTDLVGGTSGRLGDVCLFSLHKMLPLPRGGMLLINPGAQSLLQGRVPDLGRDASCALWQFDLAQLAHRRVENANFLRTELTPLIGRADPLWEGDMAGQVPQTFPVLIQTVNRDRLYQEMNAIGFGVVSLYHTLIDAIVTTDFPQAHRLSRQIMNLPLHQDADQEALREMVAGLRACISKLEVEGGAR